MSHTLYFSEVPFTIYADVNDTESGQIIAEHQILDATYTTMQYMGAKSAVKTLQFHYEDSGSLADLVTYVKDGFLARYVDDTGASGSYVISKFTYNRVQALNKVNPWYRCSMTLTNVVSSGSLYYQWTLPAPPR